MNPYLFVVGCPRSGTTLLQRMLDSHPDLAVTNDTHFIPRALAGRRVTADLPLTPELVERVVTYHRFYRLEVDQSTARSLASECSTYAEFVTALYDRVASARGKPLAGEKTPDYVRHLPLLHNLFPDARVVHIIRDGRDVALSTRDWATPTKGPGRYALWRKSPIAVCALWWRWQVTAGQNARSELSDRIREIHYEELVRQPETALQNLAAFLELPDSDRMRRFYEGKTRHDPGLSAKQAWLPATTGIRDWRTELQPDDLQLFELLAGDALAEFGYECASPSPRSARLEALAEQYRDDWAREKRPTG